MGLDNAVTLAGWMHRLWWELPGHSNYFCWPRKCSFQLAGFQIVCYTENGRLVWGENTFARRIKTPTLLGWEGLGRIIGSVDWMCRSV